MDRNLMEALYRKALGGTVEAVTEEYGGEEGDLLRRKVTGKYVPPDVGALKAYIELADGDDILSMSDEELEREKLRLLNELKAAEENKKKGGGNEHHTNK